MVDPLPVPPDGRLYVGGRWLVPSGGETREVVDPSTGTSFARAPVGTRDDARAAVDAAASAADAWAAVPGHERAARLRAIAERLEAGAEPAARGIAREVGKPIAEARLEVRRAVGVFRFAAEEIRQLRGESFPADAYELPAGNAHRLLFTVRDPIGVVAAIGPFNFPLNLLAHKVAPALAAGNPVVVKPASAAPLTGLLFASLAEAGGLPAGVVNVVPGPAGTIGDALIDHPATRLVTFTGSTEVGQRIAERAGRHAKRLLLEMGGLDPLVVLDDAPLDVAVAAAVRGAFAFSGQVCTASKRILVAEGIAAPFSRRIVDRVEALRVGPALDEATEVGPVISPEALDRLDRLVGDARDRAGVVLTGGARAPEAGPGFFYRPTVVDRVPPGAAIAREEPFGPAVPILRFDSIEEAIRLANATPYGLQASIYTRDLDRALAFARGVRAGGVHVNDPTTLRWDALPFGGAKASGIGREGVAEAMREMTELKLVSINYGGAG
ncbi:MAG TPA: aldehyde dehydrogenase family protein [Thermoplasmata archaeon]|nr:aldehyde dehydrogenase family protein [Thermoplasmata archaeon]